MDQWSRWIWVIIVSCRRRFLYTFFIWYTHMKIMKEQCYSWWLRNPAITTWDVSIPVNIGILYQPQPMQDFFKGAIFARLFCDSSSSYSNSLMWEVCMEKNSGSSLMWDMAGKPFRNPDRTALCYVVFLRNSWKRRKEMKRGIPILIHSVCLSNFCRNSIAVARWGGGLIRWGKCFWKRLQIRNSRTWKNSVLGIPGNQQPAFPLRGVFVSTVFHFSTATVRVFSAATFGSNFWMIFGKKHLLKARRGDG